MNIDEIKIALDEAKAAYLAVADDKPAIAQAAAIKVKAAQRALNDAICEGAKPCPVCGAPAQGLEQPLTVKGRIVYVYEIGCGGFCGAQGKRDKAIDGDRAKAVAAWNAA